MLYLLMFGWRMLLLLLSCCEEITNEILSQKQEIFAIFDYSYIRYLRLCQRCGGVHENQTNCRYVNSQRLQL